MRVVYCGELWAGGTCLMRANALRRKGHEVIEVDTTAPTAGLTSLLRRALRKAGYSADVTGANELLLAATARCQPDVVWIDKGLSIRLQTLEHIRRSCRRVRIVHYSPDDMGRPHNQSIQYSKAVLSYDLHITTKSFNVSELLSMGARDVLFINNAYSEIDHRPIRVTAADKETLGGDVGFIGTFEEERAKAIRFLAEHKVNVRVWGSNWSAWAKANRIPNLRTENRCLWGDQYATALCSFDINLAFLRRLNRDLQTTRSIEIPACGGFMLAERTTEHLSLFAEGIEAEYFEDCEELLAKCQYYIANDTHRRSIAAAGRERCIQSGYGYEQHVQTVLNRVFK